MPEKHYLLKVLGLSGIPKLFTFGLTLVSFPLLLRALGAETYGIVLFIGAALGLFEVIVDFGVSSAAGKSMAAVRAHQPAAIRSEFFVWIKLQAFFLVFGFAPMLFAAYLMIKHSPEFQDMTLLLVMSAAVAVRVILNFIRPNLQSLLAFKSLAVLDTSESIIRSSGFLLVAFLFPNALGLAYAGLATAFLSSVLAIVLITLRLSAVQKEMPSVTLETSSQWTGRHKTLKARLRESANFLWLRFSSRLFQEGPMIIMGRLLGAEVVGIVGAFRKVSEIISTPYLVIGNALMVRVHEVERQGRHALQSLWDAAIRIVSTSLFFTALVFLVAEPLAELLLPESNIAAQLFLIMTPLVFFSSLGGMIAPMSDYMGGLGTRNILLTLMSVIQIILLWLASAYGGTNPAVAAMVLTYGILVLGYVWVASHVLGSVYLKPKLEIVSFMLVVMVGSFVSHKLSSESSIIKLNELLQFNLSLIYFLIFFIFALVFLPRLRRFYLTRKFFELTDA